MSPRPDTGETYTVDMETLNRDIREVRDGIKDLQHALELMRVEQQAERRETVGRIEALEHRCVVAEQALEKLTGHLDTFESDRKVQRAKLAGAATVLGLLGGSAGAAALKFLLPFLG